MQQSPCCRELFGTFSILISQVLLGEKLKKMDVDTSTVHWIIDDRTGRLQFVHVSYILSDVEFSKTGTPQETVLSPFLFSLSTDFSLQLFHATCRNFPMIYSLLGQKIRNRRESTEHGPAGAGEMMVTAAEIDKQGVWWESHLPGWSLGSEAGKQIKVTA